MRRTCCLFLVLGLGACRPDRVPSSSLTPQPETEKTSAGSMPPVSAKVSATPADDGEFGVALESTLLRPSPQSTTGYRFRKSDAPGWVVRVVGESDEMLAVEPYVRARSMPDDRLPRTAAGMAHTFRDRSKPIEMHCAGMHARFEAILLRFYVRAEELAEVTRERVERRHDDGTSVTVLPGAVIEREGKVASAHSFFARVALDVRAGETGRRYDAAQSAERRIVGLLESPAGLRHGKDGWIEIVGDWIDDGTMLPVFGAIENGRVRTGDNCIDALAHTNAEEMVPSDGSYAETIAREMNGREWLIAPKTPITWPDGTPAGETTGELDVDFPEPASGDRSCFELDVDATPVLVVCAPQSAIRNRFASVR